METESDHLRKQATIGDRLLPGILEAGDYGVANGATLGAEQRHRGESTPFQVAVLDVRRQRGELVDEDDDQGLNGACRVLAGVPSHPFEAGTHGLDRIFEDHHGFSGSHGVAGEQVLAHTQLDTAIEVDPVDLCFSAHDGRGKVDGDAPDDGCLAGAGGPSHESVCSRNPELPVFVRHSRAEQVAP